MISVPPFIPNSPDDMHCVNAVFRMLFLHFRTTRYSWRDIDRITRAVHGKGTWTVGGDIALAQAGVSVRNIEPVDYEILYRKGPVYLREVFGNETADYYLTRSNITSVLPIIPEFLKTVVHETRESDVTEILGLLSEGKLIGATVHASILNGTGAFSLHYVLLYGYDGSFIHMHDPGLPPVPGRLVTPEAFGRCFRYPGGNGGIDVFWDSRPLSGK